MSQAATAPADRADQLLAAIGALPPERFAVVDGARFDDLPAALKEAGLGGRPLYLEGTDASAVASGPHLVVLDTPHRARRLIDLIGALSAAVFWSWPAGTDALYRHLRTLNVARVARTHWPTGPDDFETMLFRHGDPDVIGLMVEVMDAGQRATLLGDSAGIAFSSPKLGGVRSLMAVAPC